jgi:proton-dependent oligopeptide transporter, POT family
MAKSSYRTSPDVTTGMPPGVPYIIGNEAAERFSFYGMKTILVIFMTKYLMDRSGELAPMSDADAKVWFHTFSSAVYFLPIFGALLADALLGKYKTILWLSIVYCLGHLALAMDETRLGLSIGLTLIAIGSGGIKPCVSANVGDQFGPSNKHLISKVFSWFYFSINFGSFFSTLLTPWLLVKYGPSVAFGIPGLLMLIATIIFWAGRRKYVHVPPGGTAFVKEAFSGVGLAAIGKLAILYVFIAMFWALFDQTGSAWVLQAENMDRNLFGVEVLSSQIQAANPAMVMVMIPLFSYVIYPLLGKVFPLTPLRKITIGLFLAAGSFAISAYIEQLIQDGGRPSIMWQILAYVVITAAEVMVSITALEFSYTQAPRRMKSMIMSLYLLSVSLGNIFTAGVNAYIQNDDGTTRLEGADYYWFFTGAMAATAAIFIVVAYFYKPREYIQGEEIATPAGTKPAQLTGDVDQPT